MILIVYNFNLFRFNSLNVKDGKFVFKYIEVYMLKKLVIFLRILIVLRYFKNKFRI